MSYMSNVPAKNGEYIPINEDKYVGTNYPKCRSSWERLFCQWLDINQQVKKWSSEIMHIEYFDPVRRKKRRYYPDFLIQVEDKKNNIVTYLIEIKPHKESHPPRADKRKTKKTLMIEELKWLTNQAKFKAATEYCKRKGWIFKIITELQLFKKKSK